MQRRAVAVYVALFVLVGVATGALIATADDPEISFEDPDFTLSEGDEFEYEDTTYTVTLIEEVEDEDDLGVVTVTTEGEIEWEEVVEHEEFWDNESTVTLDEREWTVVIEGDEPDGFTLHEELDRQAILEDDPDADNETVESDGTEYVVVRDEDGEATLVPADEYFPEPEQREYAEGDTFEYDDHEATVAEVTADTVHVVWEAPTTQSADIQQQDTVELGGTEFVTYFPDSETLVLSSDHDEYEAQLAEIERFDQTIAGMTRVIVLSVMALLLVVSMAFVPSRY